ncbi:MAG: nitroreductase [Bacteroidota bacterium]
MSQVPTIQSIIRDRRSIFPKMFIDKPIDRAIIEELLDLANFAPTHALTEPWRFIVLTGASKTKVGDHLTEWYLANVPEERQSEMKLKKFRTNTEKAGAIIAIVRRRDPDERIPEWEETAAVAMAVQNMWLSLPAYDLGGYWSSPRSMIGQPAFLNLEEREACLGLFYLGYHQAPELPAKRTPSADKVRWMD